MMDKARPNRGVGMVRTRLDDCVEEYVFVDGDKQVDGVSTIEGQSMDHNPEFVVEVLDRQTFGTCDTDDKLKVMNNRTRHAKLEKISIRGRGRVDRAGDHSKEDIASQFGGMFDDGKFAQGENDSI